MSTPPIQPLERLQVSDGLLLTADRWQVAHAYHRQRQNLHFQALNQPGIVCGLHVQVIPAPSEISSQYRDGRWLQVQPGMAIDARGNPIVVPAPITYRIAATPVSSTITIYLVLSYVDPDQLKATNGETTVVQETFRLDERNSPPDELDVELCRIELQPGVVELQMPTDCFFPTANQVDLRFRQIVRSRPQGIVKVAQIETADSETWKTELDFEGLFDGLEALYPQLRGERSVTAIPADAFFLNGISPTPAGAVSLTELQTQLNRHDLLYIRHAQLAKFTPEQVQPIGGYLQQGGTLLIEVPAYQTNLDELMQVQYEVRSALAALRTEPAQLPQLEREFVAELGEITVSVAKEVETLVSSINAFAERVGIQLDGTGQLNGQHPLRSRPFRFVRYPVLNQTTIEVLNWGGIILVIGSLSSGWGYDENLALTRDQIRGAQELGINILNFAWRRRQMMQNG